MKELSGNKVWLPNSEQSDDDSDDEEEDSGGHSIFNRMDTRLENLPDLSSLDESRRKLAKVVILTYLVYLYIF